jgi:hypothetical protein
MTDRIRKILVILKYKGFTQSLELGIADHGQFAQFCGASIGWHKGAFHKNPVQFYSHLGCFLAHVTHHSVITDQFITM